MIADNRYPYDIDIHKVNIAAKIVSKKANTS